MRFWRRHDANRAVRDEAGIHEPAAEMSMEEPLEVQMCCHPGAPQEGEGHRVTHFEVLSLLLL